MLFEVSSVACLENPDFFFLNNIQIDLYMNRHLIMHVVHVCVYDRYILRNTFSTSFDSCIGVSVILFQSFLTVLRLQHIQSNTAFSFSCTEVSTTLCYVLKIELIRNWRFPYNDMLISFYQETSHDTYQFRVVISSRAYLPVYSMPFIVLPAVPLGKKTTFLLTSVKFCMLLIYRFLFQFYQHVTCNL